MLSMAVERRLRSGPDSPNTRRANSNSLSPFLFGNELEKRKALADAQNCYAILAEPKTRKRFCAKEKLKKSF